MHHTDYSRNHRYTHRKTLKKLSPNELLSDSGSEALQDLRYAAIAAVLVLVSLFNMDPANADSRFESDMLDVEGYGTLVFNAMHEPTSIKSVANGLTMTLDDEQMNLRVEQTFSAQPQTRETLRYTFALPTQASILSTKVEAIHCAESGVVLDQPCTQTLAAVATTLIVTTTRNRESVSVSVPVLAMHHRLHIELDILIPNKAVSVSAAAASIGSLASRYALGIVQTATP